ncbi:MAG: ABC transporter ATP-binding protein [Oscillospiraceae bacterium]|jgi:simple sugar transport system ATP-binding protein|nr:ABC transporter ATP-binding protein [Oscillospiraceae bacterium]
MKISPEYAVQMRGITKTFGSLMALNKVGIDVKKGTIHAILGENGAGKTTLMNILYGFHQADEGEIFLEGKKVFIKTPHVAIAHKIGMVHQHFMLVDNFTVTENIILGNEIANKLGIINYKKARNEILKIVKKYRLDVDPDAKIENISIGMQQRVEILRALYRGIDILVLDEPTAVLTPMEISGLIKIMHELTKDGKTVIIITHKLKEIKSSSEFCTIIRRGEYIDTVNVRNKSEEELGAKMVGRAIKLVVDKDEAKPGKTVFEIENLHVYNERKISAISGLCLKVRAGEILGIAGVDGNGQKELVEAIMCLKKVKSGVIKINGKEIQNTSVLNVLKNKIATIHEDRQKRGLILDFTVSENAILGKYKLRPYSKNNVLNNSEIGKLTKKLIENYDVRPKDCQNSLAKELSGGNQQKLIIGRQITCEPDLLIAVQPTRGLDVGAIESIHRILIEERDKGKAILLISLELDEIINVADTIAVIYNGNIIKTFSQNEADEKVVGLFMAGGKVGANARKNS